MNNYGIFEIAISETHVGRGHDPADFTRCESAVGASPHPTLGIICFFETVLLPCSKAVWERLSESLAYTKGPKGQQ